MGKFGGKSISRNNIVKLKTKDEKSWKIPEENHSTYTAEQ